MNTTIMIIILNVIINFYYKKIISCIVVYGLRKRVKVIELMKYYEIMYKCFN